MVTSSLTAEIDIPSMRGSEGGKGDMIRVTSNLRQRQILHLLIQPQLFLFPCPPVFFVSLVECQ